MKNKIKRMQLSFTAEQIATIINGTVEGNPQATVSTFSKIEEGLPNSLSFLANPKYTSYIYDTKASIVLVNKDFQPEKPLETTIIRCESAYTALAILMEMVDKLKNEKTGIEPMCYIDDSAIVGENVYVGAFAYIGKNVKIGNDVKIYPQVYLGDNVQVQAGSVLYSGVKIYHDCQIGKDCIIHSGVVVGGDGFGFAPQSDGTYKKIPQLGNVIIENNVEVGANTTIDRAAIGSTIIRQGVKLDNLVQVAHNVEIGENTVMAALVGIAGSSKVGRNCMFGGQVGIGGHISIGDNSSIGAQSGIISNVKPESKIIGSPAIPVKQFFKSSILFGKLPEIYKDLNEMRKELNNLKNNLDN